jgi:hypothetical protein
MPKREGAGRKPGVRKEEIERRVNLVTELIIRGFNIGKVIELLEQNERARGTNSYRAELDWGVRTRAVQDYYRKAQEKLRHLSNMTIEMELALARSRYEDLYQRALSKNALGVAARALRDKTELLTLRKFVVDSSPEHNTGGSTPDTGESATATEFRLADGTVIRI